MLIELLVALALSSLILPVLLGGLVTSMNGKQQQKMRLQATTLLREQREALRALENTGWSNFSGLNTNTHYYTFIDGNTWSIKTGEETINNIKRYITIEDVYRDVNGAIVTSGGSIDPSTKRIISFVIWDGGYGPTQVSSEFFISRTENTTKVETSKAQFDLGSFTDVASKEDIAAGDDGGIILKANQNVGWCNPLLKNEVNLNPMSLRTGKDSSRVTYYYDVKNPTSPISNLYIEGGQSNSASTISMTHIAITGDEPPIPTIVGRFKGFTTSDIVVTNDGKFAIVTTDKTPSAGNKTIAYGIDLQTKNQNNEYTSYTAINENITVGGRTVALDNNILYVTTSNKWIPGTPNGHNEYYLYVYKIDTSTNTFSFSKLGGPYLLVGSYANDSYISKSNGKTYLYLTIDGTSYEVAIYDVTNIANAIITPAPTPILIEGNQYWTETSRSIDLDDRSQYEGENGLNVYVNPNDTRLFVSIDVAFDLSEFFMIDVSYKPSLSEVANDVNKLADLNCNYKNVKSGNKCIATYEAHGIQPHSSRVVLGETQALIAGVDVDGSNSRQATTDDLNAEEYQVIRITDTATTKSLIRCGGMQFDYGTNGGIYGMTTITTTNNYSYAYLLGHDVTNSVDKVIILQGPPEGSYHNEGTFKSNIQDLGTNVTFNKIITNANLPEGTGVKYQVAITTANSGSCPTLDSDYTYVGPDRTKNTYFNKTGPLPLGTTDKYSNPGRCAKYKAILSSTIPDKTPEVYDVTLNYAP